jgi:hypothetical protein
MVTTRAGNKRAEAVGLLTLSDDSLLRILCYCGPEAAVRCSGVQHRLKRLAREDDIWREFWQQRATCPQIQAASEAICANRSRYCASIAPEEFEIAHLASVERWQSPPLQSAASASVFFQYAAKHAERASATSWMLCCSAAAPNAPVLKETKSTCSIFFRGRLFDSDCGAAVGVNEVGEPLRCEWPGCAEGRCGQSCPHDWQDRNPTLDFLSCGFCRITFCSSHARGTRALLKARVVEHGKRQIRCVDCKLAAW